MTKRSPLRGVLYLLMLAGLWLLPLAGQTAQTTDGSSTEPDSPAEAESESAAAPARPFGEVDRVAIITLGGMVNEVMQTRLIRQSEEAINDGADVIVLEMDTWGGLAVAALEMCDHIKRLEVPTVAWVNPKAISAGAMISVACDQIVVAPRARIGDSAPISGGGAAMGETEREKIETVIREEFRDSAERNGYPVTLAEAMVTRGPAIYQIRNRVTDELRYVRANELYRYQLEIPEAGESSAGLNAGAEAAASIASAGGAPARTQMPSDLLRDLMKQLEEGGEEGQQSSDQPEEDAEQSAAGVPEAETPPAPQSSESAERESDDAADAGDWVLVKRVLGEDKLLTLSQDEALEFGFAERVVSDDAELAGYLGTQSESLQRLEATWSEKMVAFLTHPAVRGLLTIIMLMGLYSEMQAPGIGFAGLMALLAGGLLFGAPYLAGMAQWWEILLVVAGIALIVVEIFVIPGFGVAGISGIVLILFGLVLTFVPEDPGPGPWPTLEGTWDALATGLLTVLIAMVVSLIGMALLTRFFGSIPLFNRLVLASSQQSTGREPSQTVSAGIGGTGSAPEEVEVGDRGVARGPLRPGGRAEINGQIIDVVSVGGWIDSGAPVRVHKVRGSRVEVEEA